MTRHMLRPSYIAARRPPTGLGDDVSPREQHAGFHVREISRVKHSGGSETRVRRAEEGPAVPPAPPDPTPAGPHPHPPSPSGPPHQSPSPSPPSIARPSFAAWPSCRNGANASTSRCPSRSPASRRRRRPCCPVSRAPPRRAGRRGPPPPRARFVRTSAWVSCRRPSWIHPPSLCERREEIGEWSSIFPTSSTTVTSGLRRPPSASLPRTSNATRSKSATSTT